MLPGLPKLSRELSIWSGSNEHCPFVNECSHVARMRESKRLSRQDKLAELDFLGKAPDCALISRAAQLKTQSYDREAYPTVDASETWAGSCGMRGGGKIWLGCGKGVVGGRFFLFMGPSRYQGK